MKGIRVKIAAVPAITLGKKGETEMVGNIGMVFALNLGWGQKTRLISKSIVVCVVMVIVVCVVMVMVDVVEMSTSEIVAGSQT